jgi:hypothetical protein
MTSAGASIPATKSTPTAAAKPVTTHGRTQSSQQRVSGRPGR